MSNTTQASRFELYLSGSLKLDLVSRETGMHRSDLSQLRNGRMVAHVSWIKALAKWSGEKEAIVANALAKLVRARVSALLLEVSA